MKIQIAKKMLNLLAVFAVILVCWSAAVFACEPECPDCWSGDDCDVWECGSGNCCGGSCCSNQCCNDACCDEGQCCGDGGECEFPDTNWSPTVAMSIEADQSIVDAVNAAINAIPCVSGAGVEEIRGEVSAKQRECCDSGPMKHETCSDASLTLSTNLGRMQVWGPPAFVEEINFGAWGASLRLTLGAFISGEVSARGTIGKYANECGDGCGYASASMGAGITASIEGSACCCLRLFGTDHCGEASVSGSASISWDGSVRNNQCANCDGFHGSFILNDITAAVVVKIGSWEGSLSYPIYPL